MIIFMMMMIIVIIIMIIFDLKCVLTESKTFWILEALYGMIDFQMIAPRQDF